ncbi:MAG: methyl-accepting chemotaxis protein [Candidatus Acidiferrum sp.]
MFKNLKIAVKLTAGFSLVGGLILVVGLVGMYGLQGVQRTTATLFTVSVKPLSTLNNMANDFASLRGISREMLDGGGSDALARHRGDLAAMEADLAQESDAFGKSAVHADMKEGYSEFTSALADFERDVAQEGALLAQQKSREAAELVASNKMHEESTRAQEAIRKLGKLKLDRAQERVGSTVVFADQLIKVMFAVLLVALLVSLVSGLWIARSISRPVARVVEILDAVSMGDFTRRAEVQSRDEVGRMSAALNRTMDSLQGAMKCLDEFGRGNFDAELRQAGEKPSQVEEAVERLRGNVRSFIAEMRHMAEKHNHGETDVVMPVDKFSGCYREMALGVNGMVEGHISDHRKAMVCVAEFGKGNFAAQLEKFPGKKAFTNATIEEVRGNITSFLVQMEHMAEEHNRGEIDAVIPTGNFQGSYREMAQGLNDMVLGHILVNKKAMACVSEFGKGNFEAPLEKFPGKKAVINETIEQVRGNLKHLMKDVDLLAQAAQRGDLTVRADGKRHAGDYRRIVETINSTLELLVDPIRAVAASATSLATRSEQLTDVGRQMSQNAEATSKQAHVVSLAAEEITASLRSVETATGEMSVSINDIAKNAGEAARVAQAAVVSAEATSETVGKLGQSSQEIGQVVKVIRDIAQQTNLLALNATIEAARAGQAGRGFAVVANAVKELSKESAEATENISRRIKAIQDDTQSAIGAIGKISEVIHQVNAIAGSIASAVEEQTATTREMSRNVTEAARGGMAIAKSIGDVAAAAKSTTEGVAQSQEAAAELAQMAEELNRVVGKFRLSGAAAGVRANVGVARDAVSRGSLLSH